MKFSRIILGLGMAVWACGTCAYGQGQWIDSILPPDHLLENLPWLGDDGKVESKGLFDFEDVRGIGQKDLVLIYRQSVSVNDLDKPHNQTLVVCFYDPKTLKYAKSFEDEGGTIQWVKFLPGPDKKSRQLFLRRDDLGGNQVLKGFSYTGGVLKQVLDVSAPQIFAKFSGNEVWCSSQGQPKDGSSAEHVFSWDDVKARYLEAKAGTGTGWTGSSLAPPPAAEKPKAPAVPTVVQAALPAAPAAAKPPAEKAKGGWWDVPLDAQASLQKLTTELVPQLVKDKKVPELGQKAKAFFQAVSDSGIKGPAFKTMRSSYYASVAQATLEGGNEAGAREYLKLALQLDPANVDASALKEKLK